MPCDNVLNRVPEQAVALATLLGPLLGSPRQVHESREFCSCPEACFASGFADEMPLITAECGITRALQQFF